MSGRYEQEKRRIEESGSPLVKHSRNQHKIKSGMEGDIRVSRTLFFSDDKASRARARNELRCLITGLIISQMERCLKHFTERGRVTPEEADFFNKHKGEISDYGDFPRLKPSYD